MLKINLQLFAEGEGDPTTPPVTPAVKPSELKTFSEDYVHAIREEEKNFRLNAKGFEIKLKEVLGMSLDADLSDVDNLIKNHKESSSKAINEAITKANDRLIKAEIKALEGYNVKLVDKLLDKSKLTIGEDGTVTGLTEALTELEKEFAEIKKVSQGTSGVNPPGQGTQTDLQQLELQYAEAEKKGDLAMKIMLRNQIFNLTKK